MASKKLIEESLHKSYKGELNSGLNSALFQDICETALEIISENEKLTDRLQISPQGDDKIDELEEAINHFKFVLDTKNTQSIGQFFSISNVEPITLTSSDMLDKTR